MKYVIISDLHVMLTGYSLIIDGIPEKIYFPLHNLKKAAEKAKEINGELIIAGDIIDEKEKLHQVILDQVIETLEYCKSIVPVHIVLGNHDYIVYNNKIFSFLFKYDFNIAKPGEPLFLGDTVLIAHSPTREQISQDFQNINLESTKLIVSHFGLQEGKVGNLSYKGGEFSIKDFKELQETLLILGHYHKPQKVAENIHYVGSVVPVKVDERDDEKRYLIVDTETLEIENIPTEYPKIVTKDIDYSEIDLNEITAQIENTYSKFVLNIPKDHPQKKEIEKIKKEYQGYIYTYEQDLSKQEDLSKNEQINVNEVSIMSISDEFLEKSNIPKSDWKFHKETISKFL